MAESNVKVFSYEGDVSIIGNFDVNTKKPLDSRNVVDTVDQLYLIDYHVSYVGMPVTVIAEEAIYILLNDNLRNVPEGWKKIGHVDINDSDGTINLDSFVKKEEFDELIDEKLMSRFMTAREVNEILNNNFNF